MPINHRELLCELLGLENSSTDESIQNSAQSFQTEVLNFKKSSTEKIEQLTNAAKPVAELTKKVETLTNSNKSLTDELIAYDLAKYAPVISNADEVKGQLLNNRTATIAVLKNSAAAAAKTNPEKVGKAPIHNSKEQQPKNVLANGGATATMVNAEDISATDAKKIMNRARELQGTGKMLNLQSAMAAARAEFVKSQN